MVRSPFTLPLNTPLQTVAMPNSEVCFWCLGRGIAFVNILAVCSASRHASGVTVLLATNCRIECIFKSMCRLLGDRYGFFAIEIAPRLSLLIGNRDCKGMSNSVCRLQSHRASVPTCARATYSASVVDKAVWYALWNVRPIGRFVCATRFCLGQVLV